MSKAIKTIELVEVPEAVSKAKAVLSANQLAFADLFLSGINKYECYKLAYDHPECDDKTAASAATRCIKSVRINNYVRAVRDVEWKEKALCREEKRAMLGDIARTSPDEILDENDQIKPGMGHLVQEITRVTTEYGTQTRLKMPSKLEAIKMDNAMTGDDAPIRIEGHLTLNSLLDGARQIGSEDNEQWDVDENA